jgi:hypothetical protein
MGSCKDCTEPSGCNRLQGVYGLANNYQLLEILLHGFIFIIKFIYVFTKKNCSNSFFLKSLESGLWRAMGWRVGTRFMVAYRPDLGPTQPPIHWAPRALSQEVKLKGHDAGHSPPSIAEDKNGRAILPIPHDFMAYCLIN